jgi:antitoxin CptB
LTSLTDLDRTRLRWRARRGLLENDLIFTEYLDAYQDKLSDEDVSALTQLFDLGDNELLDLLLGRLEPTGALDRKAVHDVLGQIRRL